MNDGPKTSTWILIGILLIALILRLGWTLTRPTDAQSLEQLPDQREYLEIAQSLRNGEGLSFHDARFRDRVYAYRTPGYPLFVAAFRADLRWVRIAQSLLDTSTVLAIYLLACRWLPPLACAFASLLVAFNPFLIYFCGLLLTETLFTCMLVWGMYLLTSRRIFPWLLGGAILALSVLVRPGAIALPLLLGIICALQNRDPANPYHRRWPLPVGATMLLLTFAALLPWAWRNHRVFGAWVWTSTNGGITAYDGFNPDATGASDQRFTESMPQLRHMSETQRNEYLSEQARQYVRQFPGRLWELTLGKLARTWSPRPLSSEFSRPMYVMAAMGYSIPLDLLMLMGLFSPSRRSLPMPVKLFLAAPAVYLTVAAAASVGSLRYRVPAEVPMAVLAAAGVVSMINRPQRKLEGVPFDSSLN